MRQAFVEAFEHSGSCATAERLKNLVVEIDDFSDDEKDRLRNACSTKVQVTRASGVSNAIYDAFGAQKTIDLTTDDVPF